MIRLSGLGSLVLVCCWAGDARADEPGALPTTDAAAPSAEAALTDVWFRDADTGWAVGERGLVLQTHNGGETWSPQPTGFSGRLERLSLAGDRGWIAGWEVVPLTGETSGVLLRTQDGGRSWRRERALLVPPLRFAHLSPTGHGWVAGRATALFPQGALVTATSGRAWGPPPGDFWQAGGDAVAVRGGPESQVARSLERTARAMSWLDGHFLNAETGCLLAVNGDVLIVHSEGTRRVRPAGLAGRQPRRVRLVDGARGWMSGDRGLVLRTDDGGQTWHAPPAPLPDELAEECDFRGLAVAGDAVWLVGTPGSVVVHSHDGGRTWTTSRTGQMLPLASVAFVDSTRGWAVGAAGTIVHTSDGGASWQAQRGGDRRAGLVVFAADPARVPWELLAQAAGQEGLRAQLELLTTAPVGAGDDDPTATAERLAAAVAQVGGGGSDQASRFPRPPEGWELDAERLLDSWSRWLGGDAREQLLAHLVRRLREWRPEVVAVAAAAPGRAGGVDRLIVQLALEAVTAAADRERFPAQLAVAGLEPWPTPRLVEVLPEGRQGELAFSGTAWAGRLGRTLGEAAFLARGSLSGDYPPRFPLVALRPLVGELPGRTLTAGLSTTNRGYRLEAAATAAAATEGVAQVVERQRHVGAILTAAASRPGDAVRLLGQLEDWTAGLDRAAAGQLWFRLGREYAQAGHWSLAAEALGRLARDYRDHPLTPAALVWLVQYGTSAEVGRRVEGQADEAAVAAAETPLGPPTLDLSATELPAEPGPAGTLSSDPLPGPNANRRMLALHAAQLLAQLAPAVHAEPAVAFPLAHVENRDDGQRTSERFGHLVTHRPAGAWRRAAAAELWMSGAAREEPGDLIRPARASRRPRLDGRLDDDVWRQREPLALVNPLAPPETPPTRVHFGLDGDFLYWAMHCPAAEPPTASFASGRPRDVALHAADRVELWLDTDRDRATAFRLAIDVEGRFADTCWEEPGWNPRWFLAQSHDDEGWTIEAALPLSELVAAAPTAGSACVISCRRLTPGEGASTTAAAGTGSPPLATGGLLVFGD